MRVVEGLLYLALQSVGAALFANAVVSVGLLRRPTTQRMWGTLGALPRARFVAYFGGLGLAWFIAVWLMWFWRGAPYTVPIAAVLAAIALVLAVGWAVAVVRRAR
ncbi:hypothetical protein ACQP2P_31160 [Dactylosporangium sp. CA-139114]|uniref:hypothetical protein n=1 Tax=Dactylosporangium sp. CA-139114 TaxID=3239931 RepID=UPI003D96C7A7